MTKPATTDQIGAFVVPPIAGIDAERIRAVREAADEVLGRWGRDYWLECTKHKEYPWDLTRGLAAAGLLGIGLPDELGGSGGGIVEESVLLEAMGDAGVLPWPVLMQNFARRMIIAHGSADQMAKFLPNTLSGEGVTCFAITEPDAGTNSFHMRTTAKQTSDGWLLNGQKMYISEAGDANQMLLVAKTGGSAEGRAELTLFIVDLPNPGISMTEMDVPVSAPGRKYFVHFDNALVPLDAIVGDPGSGGRSVFSALNAERVLSAAHAIGIGHHVIRKGVAFANSRAPFGTPIGAYQGVQHPLARASLQLEAARLQTYAAAAAIDAGETGGVGPNAAKFLASEAACAVVDSVIQLHGGAAFDMATDLMQFMATTRLLRIAPINNEVLLSFIANKALGLPRSY